ncbi:hypothetical protein [uncultured Alistipes sp.]|nr:hypothetical protein [uncultured Alistipes sp.]
MKKNELLSGSRTYQAPAIDLIEVVTESGFVLSTEGFGELEEY